MQNRVDWRFALDLVAPGSDHGWLQPANKSKIDIYGEYEYIDWRDEKKMPTKNQLKAAWDNYILENGTQEEQEDKKKNKKALALKRLERSASQDTIDLLELISDHMD